MYQDNLSGRLLGKNGRLSSGNRTKHIRPRYFLLKYVLAMGYLKDNIFRQEKYYLTTLPNHCKGLPSGSSELRFRESCRTPQIQTWGGTYPRTSSFPAHRSVFRGVMKIWT